MRSFQVPAYPITPLLFVVAAAALALNTIVTQPMRAGTGFAIVLLGAPAYFIWRRKSEHTQSRPGKIAAQAVTPEQ